MRQSSSGTACAWAAVHDAERCAPTAENDRRAARLFGVVPGYVHPKPLPTVWRANAELERIRVELYRDPPAKPQ
jgi:hypothetical protein